MTTETQAAFAARNGWAKSYVTQLKQDGRLVMAMDGSVDVEASLARIAATEDPSKAGVAARHAKARAGGGDGQGKDEKQEEVMEKVGASFKLWQARKMKADAEMAEQERDRRAGILVPREAAEYAIDDVAAGVRASMENLPGRWAPILFPLQTLEETQAALVEMVESELRGLAERAARRAESLRALADKDL